MRAPSSGLIIRALAASVACVLAASSACTKDNPPGPSRTVSSVNVSGGSTVTVGQTVQLSATAGFSDNTTENVTNTAAWDSSNTGVATVSPAGLVTGVSAGNADVRARFQNVTGTATMQVSAAPIINPVAAFTVRSSGVVDECRVLPGGDIDCDLDGSASTGGTGGAVTQWTWRFDVGGNSGGPVSRDTPTFNPSTDCTGYFKVKPGPTGPGFTQMVVKLVVRNAAGVLSPEAVNNNVKLFPQNQCGFGF